MNLGDLDRLYMSTLRRVVKPCILSMSNDSHLRELDLKSSSLYLPHQDAVPFSPQLLEASTLAAEVNEIILALSFAFLKEVLVPYQMCLLASMERLLKQATLPVLCDVHRK